MGHTGSACGDWPIGRSAKQEDHSSQYFGNTDHDRNLPYIFEGVNTIIRTHLGLELKKAKSHIIHRCSRDKMQINGIVLNQNGMGLNAPKRMRRRARAMAHNLYKDVCRFGAQREYYPRWGRVKGYVMYMDHLRASSLLPDLKTADPIVKEAEWNYLKESFEHE